VHYRVPVFCKSAEQFKQPTLTRGKTEENVRIAKYSYRFREAGKLELAISSSAQSIRCHVQDHDVRIKLGRMVDAQDDPFDMVQRIMPSPS
jgi:hypothetical protein